MSLRQKIPLLVLLAAGLPAMACCGIILFEYTTVDDNLTGESRNLARNETARIARDVFLLVRSQDEFSKQKLRGDLAVARHVLEEEGAVSFGSESVTWNAVNQFTKEAKEIEVPQFLIGGTWLGQNYDRLTPSPVVDKVRELVGGTCTIFQRINDAGDMLRVCTNVETDGNRAIGTFIPAIRPDKSEDPVVSSLIDGRTYVGRAFVVNAWYLSAYEPIFDAAKRVVGALYVGVRLDSVGSVKSGIADIVIGDHGSAMILGADGRDRGVCLCSHQSHADGKQMLEERDAEGALYVRNIIQEAEKLMGGDVAFTEFTTTKSDGSSRRMLAAFTYFRPWHWVIVVTADVAGYEGMITRTENAVLAVLLKCLAAVLLLVGGILFISYLFSYRIASRLGTAAGIAQEVGKGQLAPVVATTNLNTANPAPRDEVLLLEQSLSQMLVGLRGRWSSLQGSGQDLVGHVSRLPSANGSKDNVATELSELASEVTISLRELSKESQRMLRGMDELVKAGDETDISLASGSSALHDLSHSMNHLTNAAKAIATKLDEIHDRASEIDDVLAAIVRVTEQTNLLAINAAIEAEKAGELGQGFLVVAREIRRLSDQTSIAAGGIEKKVAAMHSAVSAGVMAMDKLADAVRRGAKDTEATVASLPEIGERTQRLREQLDHLRELAQAHARRAQHSVDDTRDVVERMEHAASHLRQLGKYVDELQNMADDIYETIDQVKVVE